MKSSPTFLLLVAIVLLITSRRLFLPEEAVNAESCGNNTCNIYNDAQGTKCYSLDCSPKGPSCPSAVSGCEYVPTECGPGSHISPHVSCGAGNKSVGWSYYCAATGLTRLKNIPGMSSS